jgi:Rieske Fe-S protein
MAPDVPPSLDDLRRLDALLDALAGTGGGGAPAESREELAAWMLAAQLSSIGGPVEPDPGFIRDLERRVAAALPDRRATRRRVTRRGFLRSAAAAAGAAGVAAATTRLVVGASGPEPPSDLIPEGDGRWYDIAAVDELAPGAMKPFTAGGLVGYLVNDAGELRAVSGICTHMGCRVRPTAVRLELRCLCHRSRFDASGRVLEGLAPAPLPAIELQVAHGRVYALGTKESL